MSRIRTAVIGTGFSGLAHVDALHRLPGVEIVGIAARTGRSGRQAAARLGLARGYDSWQELVADESVDAVHNCTPNHLHREINCAVLETGKHLLSEKPLGTDSRETAALAALAAETNVVSAVCFNYRHYPLVRQAKELLASGEYGRAHLVHGGYLQDWLLFESDWNWRLDTQWNGVSRAVADIGSHWMDLVQHVCDERIVEVCADLATVHSARRRPASLEQGGDGELVPVASEDFGTILVRFERGTRGSFTVSQVSAGRKNRLFLEVSAAKASFAWDQEQPNALWIGHRDQANAQLMSDPELLTAEASRLARLPAGHQEGWADGLRNLLDDFYAAVSAHSRKEPYEASFATFADGHRISELVDAIVASNRSRGWTLVGQVEQVEA